MTNNEISKRPDSAPAQAQALIKIRFATCWIWFGDNGIPILDGISFIDGILLNISLFIEWLLQPDKFSYQILELYDKNFIEQFKRFLLYQDSDV